MISIVSSRLDYLEKHPDVKASFEEVEHELRHLKMRERMSGAIAVVSALFALLALGGVLGGGHIIFGALLAIGLVAALYAYLCRQAQTSLRSRQVGAVDEAMAKSAEQAPEAPAGGIWSYLSHLIPRK